MRNAKCVVRNGGRGAQSLEAPQYPNVVKLSEICNDSFRDKVSQVAQDSQVSQVSRMR